MRFVRDCGWVLWIFLNSSATHSPVSCTLSHTNVDSMTGAAGRVDSQTQTVWTFKLEPSFPRSADQVRNFVDFDVMNDESFLVHELLLFRNKRRNHHRITQRPFPRLSDWFVISTSGVLDSWQQSTCAHYLYRLDRLRSQDFASSFRRLSVLAKTQAATFPRIAWRRRHHLVAGHVFRTACQQGGRCRPCRTIECRTPTACASFVLSRK